MPIKLRLPYATALILAAIQGAVSASGWITPPAVCRAQRTASPTCRHPRRARLTGTRT
jgi:hypothetical protein